jgi:hypothetical protein
MRAFVQLRKISSSQKQLSRKLQRIEARLWKHDENLDEIFEAILYPINPPEKPQKQIGFGVREPKAGYGKKVNKNI